MCSSDLGFATADTLQQAENAILSRSQPLFSYSPSEDGVFGVFDVEVFVHDPIINTDGSGLG